MAVHRTIWLVEISNMMFNLFLSCVKKRRGTDWSSTASSIVSKGWKSLWESAGTGWLFKWDQLGLTCGRKFRRFISVMLRWWLSLPSPYWWINYPCGLLEICCLGRVGFRPLGEVRADGFRWRTLNSTALTWSVTLDHVAKWWDDSLNQQNSRN